MSEDIHVIKGIGGKVFYCNRCGKELVHPVCACTCKDYCDRVKRD